MLHMTIGVFGDSEFAKKLGKEGTKNDIAIYNHGSSEGVFTYVSVNSEKVQTLLQVVNMIDVPVFVIKEINAVLGEQLIAVNEYGFDRGFIILEGLHEEQVKPLIKGTCLEKFPVIEERDLTSELKNIQIERSMGKLVVPVDNYFNVKSVGTVILGIIKSGTVRKYDKVSVEPIGTEVVVKGIQSQDKDIEEAGPGTRVGLNLKGIEADDLKRGYVVGAVEKAKTLKIRFTKSKYTKEIVKESDQVFVSSGLQVMTGRVVAADDALEVEFDSYITYGNDTNFLLATTKQAMPRILGHAVLA